MSSIVRSRITERKEWSAGLISITVEQAADFTPGQFFNLGLDCAGKIVRRSYSAASPPGAPLEFLLSEVPRGELTPRLFALGVGDEVLIDTAPLGFFTLKEVPETKHLWLVATGTGLGPYLSMLRAGALWGRFARVTVVHGVREATQLAYGDELRGLEHRAAELNYFPELNYVPVLSRASDEPTMQSGRITHAWDTGALEKAAGHFDHDSHMLLCGNPQMIEDMASRLQDRGFERHRRRQAGHYNFEKYW
jgi:ferredoxin--NADP+ reductase